MCRTSSTDSECTDTEASSIASDQDRFDTVYDAFRDLANDLYHIDLRRYSRGLDGQEKLQELVHLPRTWPLARLTIPLEGLSKQIDRLLEGYCGRALEVKGLQSASCCQAAKMRMTDLTSCYRRRTFGLPLQRGVLSQSKSQHSYSAFFFSCNAGLVLDMVGQLLEKVKTDFKSPW